MAPVGQAGIIAAWLAANDSRDKLIKGAGCFFKALGAQTANANYLSVGSTMSECRCLMRLCSWLNNVKKLSDALEKRVVQPRDVIYVLRVLFDGIFSLLDNVVFIGSFFQKNNTNLSQLSIMSRASLFWGYVAAVLLDIYDLAYDKAIPNRKARYLVLTRNACDMVSCLGNVCSVDLGTTNTATLGLISACIASRELYGDARAKSMASRKLAVGDVSK